MSQLGVEVMQAGGERRPKIAALTFGDDAAAQRAKHNLGSAHGAILLESDCGLETTTEATLELAQSALDAKLHAR
jgi:hypothetical protein